MAAIKGNRIAYLYRILSEASTTAGTAIAFTTENSRSKSRDADTVSTKSGTIRVPGDTEVEISTTALFASENDPMISKLEKALDDSAVVEVWEVNLDIKGTLADASKFKAKYFQAYVTNLELSSNSEGIVIAVSVTLLLTVGCGAFCATVCEKSWLQITTEAAVKNSLEKFIISYLIVLV